MLLTAKYIKDYTLLLTFSDDSTILIDFEQHLRKKAIYKKYLLPANFLKYKVVHGCLEWPGNVLDFHHNQLRNFYTPKAPATLL